MMIHPSPLQNYYLRDVVTYIYILFQNLEYGATPLQYPVIKKSKCLFICPALYFVVVFYSFYSKYGLNIIQNLMHFHGKFSMLIYFIWKIGKVGMTKSRTISTMLISLQGIFDNWKSIKCNNLH